MLVRRLLTTLAVASAVVAGAVSPDAAEAAPRTLTGVLRSGHGDPAPGRATRLKTSVWLETASGRTEALQGVSARTVARYQGQVVTVRGRWRSGAVRPASVRVPVPTPTPVPLPTADTRSVAVVLMTFAGTPAPFSPEQAQQAWFGASGSVDDFYRQASYGRRSLTGQVFGWYAVDTSNQGCRYSEWGNAAKAAANAAGAQLSRFQHVAVVWPRTPDCGWSGMASVGGGSIWIDGYGLHVQTLAHELGHNFTFMHAASLRCVDGAGNRTPLSSSCTSSEYGDPFDVMGGGARLPSAFHRSQRGWTPDVTDVVPGTDYLLAPLPGAFGPRQLRYVRADGTALSFELRQAAAGFDAFNALDPAVTGVVVRRTPRTPSSVNTFLVDTNPETLSFADAPLRAGRTLSDPLDGTTFSVLTLGPAGALVRVGRSSPGPAGPTAPSHPSEPPQVASLARSLR